MKITIICIPTLMKVVYYQRFQCILEKVPTLLSLNLKDGEIKEINVIESVGKHKGVPKHLQKL